MPGRGNICIAPGCVKSQHTHPNLSFHRIPTKNPALLRKWLSALGVGWRDIGSDSRVCSGHFRRLDFSRDLKSELCPNLFKENSRLKSEAVPSLFCRPAERMRDSVRNKETRKQRQRKIKKSLGPDFESYGTVKRCRLEGQSVEGRAGLVVSAGGAYSAGSSEASMDPVCDYCLLGKERNRKGQEEDLLICKDCQAKAHPSCMDYSQDLARRARTSPWQCIDCKTCCICEDAGDPDAMLFCDACDKGYHMSCHSPVVEDKPTGKWICSRCMLELGIESPDHIDSQKTSSAKTDVTPDAGAHGLPTPSASPVQFHDTPVTSAMKINGTIVTPIPKLANTMKAEVPDASEWTVDDVVSFFTEVGFPDQAEVLRHQEIDGKSLLLLKRSDVLTGLSFKLGPALKIYAHVQRLQTQGQILL